jgi:hypothetical protein
MCNYFFQRAKLPPFTGTHQEDPHTSSMGAYEAVSTPDLPSSTFPTAIRIASTQNVQRVKNTYIS